MPYSQKQIDTLQTERTNDPLTRGYGAMDDNQFLTSITTEDRDNPIIILTSDQIYNALDPTELAGLGVGAVSHLDLLLTAASGQAGVSVEAGATAIEEIKDIFGPSSATEINLLAFIDTKFARFEELGLPEPTLADVARTS